MLYKSLIIPRIDYCSPLLLNLRAYKIRELQVTQNRCLQLVLTSNKHTFINTMLKVLNTMHVKNRITYNTLIAISKIDNSSMPQYFQTRLT